MKKTAFLIIFGLLVSFSIGYSNQPTILTLSSAVDIALEKNIAVLQAQYALEAQQSGTLAAYGGLLPSVDASAGFTRRQNWVPVTGGFFSFQGITIPYTSGGYSAQNSWNSSISASIMLFNGFANTSNIKRAEASEAAAESRLNLIRQQAIYQTNQLFLNVYRTNELLKVSEDNLKRSKRQLERIIESNKVGAIALADVYRQQVQTGTDELALIQAQSNYEKAKVDLLVYLGVDLDKEYVFDFQGIQIEVDTAEFAVTRKKYADYQALVNQALMTRPDYLGTIENYRSADASVTIARAGYLPSLSTYVSYGFSNQELKRITDNKNLMVGLSVNVPIFNGFSTRYQIEQSQVQRKNAEEEVKQSERQVMVDIRKALLDLEAAEKQVIVTQKSVESALMDRKIAEEKYNLGAGTLLDLLVAQANYTTALSNKVNVAIGYLLAKKQVELALGNISK